ncbi:hypothetical protein AN639_00960 [Candidatus Epulonipiscium fishelsonii]|uniref:Uncharacterized protein n=1 Tax=Candidatus Epulonipiscium fishelsonii TaxID=77094 RepID=A0ACC8XCC7_9FIRM|nr:hypothetical protein AN396_06135 [Epulopiscium sp. SCG-B11WGA-EpuloA1]ONI41363.1 hypothetical protein AN639_00960 [Epulopiscium sp. SCG-B05WGA-EpuloA1]
MKTVKVISSDKETKKWFCKSSIEMHEGAQGKEMELLVVFRDIAYQEIKGFGGTFTQASAYTYSRMNKDIQKEIMESYFGKTGLKYTIGRTHINSCDFSFGNYAYCDKEGDVNLETFSLDCDKDYVIPFIKEALNFKGEKISLLASPWSPPAWLKTNNNMLKGGKLKTEYYEVWAKYFVKYIQAYKKEGIEIDMITTQNEPHAVQTWESCIYNDEEEKVFIRDYLYPALKNANLDTKIVIWDHNKEYAFQRAKYILSDPKANEAVYGIAFHWYSGDHFENLSLCREFFPSKELIFAEGCVELTTTATTMAMKANSASNGKCTAIEGPWEFGECYAHDIMGNINHGLNQYIDWNLLLDETGGPNHVSNFCSAPIMCDTINQKLIYQPPYYFIGHLSKYVPAGSKRIAHSKYTSDLTINTFLTPKDEVVVVVLNTTENEIPLNVKDVVTDSIFATNIKAKSITTFIY